MNTHVIALRQVLSRIEHIEQRVGERFPLCRQSQTEVWTTTRRGSWAGGFWVGLLWLRAAITQRPDHRTVATNWMLRLLPRAEDDTVTRAMTFGYGAAVPHLLTGDPCAAQIGVVGANALVASFDTKWRLIPVGTAFERDASPRAAVDALAGVVTLLSWSGDAHVAHRHAIRLAALCVEPDGRVRAEVSLVEAQAETMPWIRGHSWAMLGFSVAADRLGAAHLGVAELTADWWLRHCEHPSDSSAVAIAAAALLTLPDARYRRAGLSMVDALAAQIQDDGVLTGAQYGDFIDAEVIWGTYFTAALLASVTGSVSAAPW